MTKQQSMVCTLPSRHDIPVLLSKVDGNTTRQRSLFPDIARRLGRKKMTPIGIALQLGEAIQSYCTGRSSQVLDQVRANARLYVETLVTDPTIRESAIEQFDLLVL